jgi:mannosyltransferase
MAGFLMRRLHHGVASLKMRRMLETAEAIKGQLPPLTAIGVMVVVGALLRLHNLGGESLWGDEVVSWWQVKGNLAHLIWSTAQDNYPPLNNLAIFAVIKLFGGGEWSLRLPSAIFGVTNIVALWWLGTMTVGRTAGLIGAGMLTLSPFHLEYSQEARMYSLLALAATLYAATCFYYLQAPSLQRSACVSLAGLALVYSHPYGTLDWIVIAVAFAVFVLSSTSSPPRTMLVWKASNVVIATGFAPWALIFAYHAYLIAAKGFWIPPLTTTSVVTELEAVAAGRAAVAGGRLFAGVILIGVLLGVVGRLSRDVVVLYVWAVAPVAIGIAASILSKPVFLPRYVIGSLPPLLLISAFGWAKYAQGWPDAVIPMAAAVLVAIAGSASMSYNYSWYPKDDFRGVASFLDKREQPTDCILIVPGFDTVPIHFYRRNSSCEVGARKVADLPSEIPASVLFGIFCYAEDIAPPDAPAVFVDELRRRGWRELDRTDFQGVRVVTFGR